MAGIFAYRCGKCDNLHEGSPSYGFDSPWHYHGLNEQQKSKADLTPDTCVIPNDEGADRFVRVVLEIPIHGVEEPFLWGVWVSLSEKNFSRFCETSDNPDETDSYFGWFCSRLPYYDDTLSLKSHVRPRKGKLRPYLELEETDHQLSKHYHAGLTIQQAQEIAEELIHRDA